MKASSLVDIGQEGEGDRVDKKREKPSSDRHSSTGSPGNLETSDEAVDHTVQLISANRWSL